MGQSIASFSLQTLYPRTMEVFEALNVDESYLYDTSFLSFVQKNEPSLKAFHNRSLKRGKEIIPTLKTLLDAHGMNSLFIYLSMVESGFLTDAISPKKAVGLWQFMPKTARHYHLTVCEACDERYDTTLATASAVAYLKKLYQQFGNKWYLAMMAYNCGEGRLSRAIERAKSDDLSVLTDEKLKYLPKETRDYIKKILFLAIMGEITTEEGRVTLPPKIKVWSACAVPPIPTVEVEVAGGDSLGRIAKVLEMNKEALLEMNTKLKLKSDVLPPKKKKYKIVIPEEKIYLFYLKYEIEAKKATVKVTAKPQKIEKSYMISHTVVLGETLEVVAKIYGTSSEIIAQDNHLKKEDVLEEGDFVIVYVDKSRFEMEMKNR